MRWNGLSTQRLEYILIYSALLIGPAHLGNEPTPYLDLNFLLGIYHIKIELAKGQKLTQLCGCDVLSDIEQLIVYTTSPRVIVPYLTIKVLIRFVLIKCPLQYKPTQYQLNGQLRGCIN